MKYLDDRNGVLRYRRVYPPDVQSKIGKKEYVVSLRTRDRIVAIGRYTEHDKVFETKVAIARSGLADTGDILKVRQVAQNAGFVQFPDEVDTLAIADLIQLSTQNLQAYSALPKSDVSLVALAQTVNAKLTIDDVFEEYISLEHDKLRRKTNREKNKFLDPIKLAIKEFKAFAGDVNLLKMKKRTVLDFKKKLVNDVENGKIKVGTANKKIMHLRKIFETVRENLYSEIENPFSIKALQNDEVQRRLSFTENDIEIICKMLVKSRINDELKALIYISKDTGCGPKELALLTPGDIFLKAPIPFIRISPNEHRTKVKGGGARHREIPLVGDALEWMKKFPNGFPRYQKNNGGEAASAAANKFLKRYTEKTLYSFRHRFADLLRNTGCDQRVQNSLFGHAAKNKMEDYYGSDMIMDLKLEAVLKGINEGPERLRKNQQKESE